MNINSLVDGKFSTKTKAVIILIFLVVPFISSIVSMLHVVRFLNLGNTWLVSGTLAATYEIANLTILMAVVLMKKLRAFFVWTCFIVLLIVQIVGNVYYSYDYITTAIMENKDYLNTFISFIRQMWDFEDNRFIVFVLSCFLGLPIPMVSLLLVKSVVDYLEMEGTQPVQESNEKADIKETDISDIKYAADYTSNYSDKSILDERIDGELQQEVILEQTEPIINTEEASAPTHMGVTIKPQEHVNNG